MYNLLSFEGFLELDHLDLMIDFFFFLVRQLPELPSKNLFFNMNNRQHVDQRRQGLEDFLRK